MLHLGLRMRLVNPSDDDTVLWRVELDAPEREGFRRMPVRPGHQGETTVRVPQSKVQWCSTQVQGAWPATTQIKAQSLEKRSLHLNGAVGIGTVRTAHHAQRSTGLKSRSESSRFPVLAAVAGSFGPHRAAQQRAAGIETTLRIADHPTMAPALGIFGTLLGLDHQRHGSDLIAAIAKLVTMPTLQDQKRR